MHYKGFKLRGKHAKVKCSKCHKSDGSFTLFKKRKPRILYKPIPNNTCNAKGCHSSASVTGKTHGAQFNGRKCEECHVEKSWKPSTFDHNDQNYVGFKLIGKHARLACANCHTKSKSGKVLYKPIEHKTCNGSGCHDLPERGAIHIGQFKEKDCADCHTEKSWKPTLFTHTSKEYDGYKLLGKHAKVKCGKCHKPGGKTARYQKTDHKVVHYEPIATGTCSGKGCHDNRPHNGIFKPKDCDECHVVTGFDDMKTNFDHTLDTRFPLTGKHITAKCTNCHKKSGGKPTWKPTDEDCVSCHKKDDKHKGNLGEGCDDCHHTSSWNPKVVAHQATGFPLKETHAQLLCSDCHTRGKGDYSGLSPDCQQCHTDPHLNQMGRLCNDCHTMRNWEPMKFKHSMTGFRLEGSHRFVTCDTCHVNRIYRTISSDCYSCHQKDFFRGAVFHTPGKTNCLECHNVYAFTPAKKFVHRSMTFTGTHAAIKNECTKCHIKTSAGYTPKFPGATTEQNCFSCHSADYARRHRNCPITCTLCHNTTAFQGAVKKVPCD